MKTLATLLITGLFYCTTVSAQVKKHHIDYQVIEDDSVRISMNEEFHVTGAACGQVIRYTHLDTQRNVFIGRFKDVSTSNPQLVITEGGYDALGRKNGDFITRYSNGEFMAQGNFKSDAFNGIWKIYYRHNKPKLFFEANGGQIKITHAWDSGGKKTVDNGNGYYKVDEGDIVWKGNLVNGLPDGIWTALRRGTTAITEVYKDGLFEKGQALSITYTDAPRLILVHQDILPFVTAEHFYRAIKNCIPMPRPIPGLLTEEGNFSLKVRRGIDLGLRSVDLRGITDKMEIGGEIDTAGRVVNVKAKSSPLSKAAEASVIGSVSGLRAFKPDPKNKQFMPHSISFTITIRDGGAWTVYRYSAYGLWVAR